MLLAGHEGLVVVEAHCLVAWRDRPIMHLLRLIRGQTLNGLGQSIALFQTVIGACIHHLFDLLISSVYLGLLKVNHLCLWVA